MKQAAKTILLGWFFFILTNPVFQHSTEFTKTGEFKDQGDCEVQRTFAVRAHFKTATPDEAAAALYAGPCFQELLIQH